MASSDRRIVNQVFVEITVPRPEGCIGQIINAAISDLAPKLRKDMDPNLLTGIVVQSITEVTGYVYTHLLTLQVHLEVPGSNILRPFGGK